MRADDLGAQAKVCDDPQVAYDCALRTWDESSSCTWFLDRKPTGNNLPGTRRLHWPASTYLQESEHSFSAQKPHHESFDRLQAKPSKGWFRWSWHGRVPRCLMWNELNVFQLSFLALEPLDSRYMFDISKIFKVSWMIWFDFGPSTYGQINV